LNHVCWHLFTVNKQYYMGKSSVYSLLKNVACLASLCWKQYTKSYVYSFRTKNVDIFCYCLKINKYGLVKYPAVAQKKVQRLSFKKSYVI